MIAVYGNRDYDDTLLELKTILINSKFCCIAAPLLLLQSIPLYINLHKDVLIKKIWRNCLYLQNKYVSVLRKIKSRKI